MNEIEAKLFIGKWCNIYLVNGKNLVGHITDVKDVCIFFDHPKFGKGVKSLTMVYNIIERKGGWRE